MGRPPAGVPLSPWRKSADIIGQRIASQRKPPDPDMAHQEKVTRAAQLILEKQRGVPSETYAGATKEDLNKHMGAIHDHARMAHGGDGPYPVKGFVHSSSEIPRDVTIERTTPGQIKQEIGYGDQWGNMLEGLIDAEKNFPADHENSISRNSFGGVLKASERPIHVVTAGGPDALADKPGFQDSYGNWIYLNEQHPKVTEYGPETVKFHEATHAQEHSFLDRKKPPAFGGNVSWEDRLQKAQQYFSDPAQAEDYAKALEHGSRWAELEAHFADLKSLHYGLTGKLVRTPEENVRLLQQILTNKPAFGTKGQMFQPDPMMEHGPRAGQPASRWNRLQQIYRDVFPRGTSQEKKVLVPNLYKSASTQGGPDAVV